MNARATVVVICSGLFVALIGLAPSPVYGQDAQIEQALAKITETANQICQSAPLEQTSQGVGLSGDASAKVGGLVGKIADLGISGAAQYQTGHSRGVLQKDLIEAIQNGNSCKLEVFKTLEKDLIRGRTTSDPGTPKPGQLPSSSTKSPAPMRALIDPAQSNGLRPPTKSLWTAPASSGYADELTDFGVPPQSFLRSQVGAPTPTMIPGGRVITTEQLRRASQGARQFLLIDALAGYGHQTIPNSYSLPLAGTGGTFEDITQMQVFTSLSQLTNGRVDYPLVFFCEGARCWESYNAALRAIHMGFSNVYWYRGGIDAWQQAGLPMSGN